MLAKQHATKQSMGQQRKQRENEKNLETNENGNAMFQNLRDIEKELLRQKVIAIQPYLRKQQQNLK